MSKNMQRLVHIYQPCRTATQCGRSQTLHWLLEYELVSPRTPDPLMGWTSTQDTCNQVRLFFPTKDAAINFAQRHGWTYHLTLPQTRRITPKSYIDKLVPLSHRRVLSSVG